ncbi:MAG: aminotransferase class V-fold PLP-dependent enzyme [Terriglobia bacterium]|nr:aminotransferase class V-fold PLP-dependent enzyme [Terriglobia bacterium]
MRHKINRRAFLHALAVLSASTIGRKAMAASAPDRRASWSGKIKGLGESGNVYEELGLTTVINGQGTMTYLGGSLMRPEAEAVMKLASLHFVNINDLEAAAGKRIAEMLKLPQGYSVLVTSGAASAIQNGYSGILTGSNETYIKQIPDLTGLKSEVIIQKAHRSPWNHQIRATGVKIVEVETVADVHNAISERTAAMHFLNLADPDGQIKREDWLKLAHAANLPAFIDAAADTPPKSHLWDYANMGYDLISFSGGKAMRGPQCTGLLIGRQEMISNALLNMSPNEDTLGRPTKVGKEEIVGMLKTLEIYLAEDEQTLAKEQWRQLDTIANRVTKIPGVTVTRHVPEIANNFPTIQIHLDPAKFSIDAGQVNRELASMKPSIVLGGGGHDGNGSIGITAIVLQPGQDRIIADALSKVLREHQV